MVLHSLVPAALVGFIPARIFQSFDPVLLGKLILADAAVVAVAVLVFHLGLRFYESGNRIGTRL